MTLVRIDLLNGKKSFFGIFCFLLPALGFLNFLRISNRVLMLLSVVFAIGRLMKLKVLLVLYERLFTSLN